MKLRSVLFTVVLLLLAATVCAAQSPMGFSSSEFFRDYVGVSTIMFDEPRCCYSPTDDNTGALITVGEHAYIYLSYSGDNVTEVDHAFVYSNNNDTSMEDAIYSVFTTFAVLGHISGEDDKYNDIEVLKNQFTELMNQLELDIYGYHMELAGNEEDGTVTGLIMITKK